MNGFEHLLDDREKIVKTLRPNKKTFMVSVWFLTILVTLIYAVVCLPLLIASRVGEAPDFLTPMYWGIVLGVFFIILIIGYPIRNATYNSILYCITDKRIIIRTGMVGRDFRTIALESITTMDINIGFYDKLGGENTASIKFCTSAHTFDVNNNLNSQLRNQFTNITNANEIYKEIKNLIKIAKEK